MPRKYGVKRLDLQQKYPSRDTVPLRFNLFSLICICVLPAVLQAMISIACISLPAACNIAACTQIQTSNIFSVFMYRRPTLCTLHIAVDFLKFLKIAVVWGGVLLGYSAYIMSL
jgi:hypothetical protein